MDMICDINIPEGALFYPCCGSDTRDPLYLFMNHVNEFHFADMLSITLPDIERPNMVRRRNPMLVDQSLVKSIRPQGRISIPFEKSKGLVAIRHVNWELVGDEDRNIDIYCWKTNARNLLPFLRKIAVYYYRGDGHGEGGSEMDWLNGGWFDQVLEKMPDGALILTDCGNIELSELPTVPWSIMPRLNNSLGRSSQNMDNDENLDFEYRKRLFKYIGIYGESCKGWPVHGWQIVRIVGA